MLAERGIPRVLGHLAARRWWLLPAAVAVAVAVAAIVTAAQTPLYEADATLVVVPSSEVRDPGEVLRTLETLERRTIVATLAKVPAIPRTRASAAQRMGVAAADLAGYRVATNVQPYTNIITITVNGPEPQRAAAFANALVQASRREARSLYRTFRLEALAEAQAPGRPASPDPARNLLLAAVLGLAVGAGGAWLVGPHARRA